MTVVQHTDADLTGGPEGWLLTGSFVDHLLSGEVADGARCYALTLRVRLPDGSVHFMAQQWISAGPPPATR